MIFAPVGNAAVVGTPAFIVDDEWIDTVVKTLLQHDQEADAAVIIPKGTDLLEADAKIQDALRVNGTFLVWNSRDQRFSFGPSGLKQPTRDIIHLTVTDSSNQNPLFPRRPHLSAFGSARVCRYMFWPVDGF